MLITNHVLSGAVLGAVAPDVAQAATLGFLSHFVLDGLPHFGVDDEHLLKVAIPDGLLGLAAIAGIARATPTDRRLPAERLIDIIAQFAQCDESTRDALGGAPFRGGTTVVASSDGSVRYVIAKPLKTGASNRLKRIEAAARRDRQFEFVDGCDARDPQRAWCASQGDLKTRMLRMHNFAALHSRQG